MLTLTIDGLQKLEDAGLVSAISAKAFKEQLYDAAVEFGMDSEGRSKRDFLSGPRPEKLGVVSGRLRSSVTNQVERKGNDIEISLGTNVKYARSWELGFEGVQQVRPHMRVVSKVFGQSVNATVSAVTGHSRRVSRPAKPFLRPSLEAALPDFEQKIQEAMVSINIGGS